MRGDELNYMKETGFGDVPCVCRRGQLIKRKSRMTVRLLLFEIENEKNSVECLQKSSSHVLSFGGPVVAV